MDEGKNWWVDIVKYPPGVFSFPPYLKWIVVPLLLPFTSPIIMGAETHILVWKPVIVISGPPENEFFGFFYLFEDNLFMGSCWGLLSGYTSGAFFKPPLKFMQPMIKNKLQLAPLLAVRVVRRMTLAGLLFDVVQRYTEGLAYDVAEEYYIWFISEDVQESLGLSSMQLQRIFAEIKEKPSGNGSSVFYIDTRFLLSTLTISTYFYMVTGTAT